MGRVGIITVLSLFCFMLISLQAFAIPSENPVTEENPTPAETPAVEEAALPETPQVDIASLPCMSFGAASRGRLINGTPLPQHPGWINRSEDRQHATPELIEGMTRAMNAFLKEYPGSARLITGDVSLKNGGPMMPHRSHQSGRDIDVGMFAVGNRAMTTFEIMTPENMDIPKTWALIECLMEQGGIEYILLDYSLQEPLYRYVQIDLGASEAYLERVFQYPRGSKKWTGILRHAAGHKNHLHVRFFAPESVMAANKYGPLLEPMLAALNDPEKLPSANKIAYVPRIKRSNARPAPSSVVMGGAAQDGGAIEMLYIVARGDTPSGIAKKYNLSLQELYDLNELKPGDRLKPGMTLHVAREPEDEPIGNDQLIARFGRSRKVHQVKSGDTIWSIAQAYNVQVAQLCQWNDLTARAVLQPGQSIQILRDRPRYATLKPGALKPAKVQEPNRNEIHSLFGQVTTFWHYMNWTRLKNLFRILV